MKWRIASAAFFIVMYSVLGRVSSQDAQDLQFDKNCQMSDCSDPLGMLSSDKHELSTVAGKADMDRLCPSIMQHFDCINQKVKICMTPEMQMAFNVLYNGTIVVMTELCHNDTYQREFLKHAPCFSNLHKEENCEATYSNALNDIKKSPGADNRICCSFQEYLECSERTVGQACSKDASEFNKRMLDNMAASFKELCQQYSVASEECRSMSLASHTSDAASIAEHSLLVLTSLLALSTASENLF